MIKHFVRFYSPGTFLAESSDRAIDTWDVDTAIRMAGDIKERYGATPYGFRFVTRARGDDDLDSRETDQSPMYYLGGTVETLEEVEARNDPAEEILRANMRCNNWSRIIRMASPWGWTQPLSDDDTVLDV